MNGAGCGWIIGNSVASAKKGSVGNLKMNDPFVTPL
jgi:hypothetical protein